MAENQDKKLTYEQAMKQLEDIVTKLENNKDLSLDESIQYFERGTKLAEYCNRMLDRAEEKIRKISSDGTGADHNVSDNEAVEEDEDYITEEDFGDDGNSGDSVQADDYDNDLPF